MQKEEAQQEFETAKSDYREAQQELRQAKEEEPQFDRLVNEEKLAQQDVHAAEARVKSEGQL
ncbi:unnamed protein product, partial [Rotaria magnacalcarata]